ncbi:hypothetical protein [Streptomyces sp. NBC_01343]|uniref:hypothetical protein n=1 Tax=Streptomyces sp. NBC_01343 TaxID=2903832 RepID=UPI003FA38337
MEATGYVLAPGNTRKRIRIHGATRKEARAKLTEKIAARNAASLCRLRTAAWPRT